MAAPADVHRGVFTCACGLITDRATWEGHRRALSCGLQPLELQAMMNQHEVSIACACGVCFTSPFRFHLHCRGELEAFDDKCARTDVFDFLEAVRRRVSA